MLAVLVVIAACEPLAPYAPTPVAVVITGEPTATPIPSPTPTATPTATPTPQVVATPTPTPFPCDEATGRVIDFDENRSQVGNENLRYRVYLPPCYFATQKRFPVVYLIHGLSYREDQWQDLGLMDTLDQGIRLGALAPMIVVMPSMGNLGTRNSFPPDPSYETYILDELLPKIERDLCVWQDRDYRAIGGISRGGFWAYSIAMRHPDVFGIVGGHSAYFPNNTREIPPAYNPLELALNAAFLQEADLRMYLDNGASDSSGPSQQLFSSRLSARGVPHTYQVNPVGEHDNEYWSAHISEYLAYYADDWVPDYGQLPSCAEPSPS